MPELPLEEPVLEDELLTEVPDELWVVLPLEPDELEVVPELPEEEELELLLEEEPLLDDELELELEDEELVPEAELVPPSPAVDGFEQAARLATAARTAKWPKRDMLVMKPLLKSWPKQPHFIFRFKPR
jgi:hypothetical protein